MKKIIIIFILFLCTSCNQKKQEETKTYTVSTNNEYQFNITFFERGNNENITLLDTNKIQNIKTPEVYEKEQEYKDSIIKLINYNKISIQQVVLKYEYRNSVLTIDEVLNNERTFIEFVRFIYSIEHNPGIETNEYKSIKLDKFYITFYKEKDESKLNKYSNVIISTQENPLNK